MIIKPRLFRKPNLSNPLARGLVGCWLMNEGAGNTVQDLSGNGSTGTLNGTAPSWTAGKFGSAVVFPGTDEYILAGSSLSAATDKLTAIVWYKTSASGEGVLEINDGTSNNYFLLRFYNDTTIRFYHKPLSDVLSVITVPSTYIDGNLHMIAALYDGVRPHIYLDSIKYLGDAATGTMDLSGLIDIGANPIFGDYLSGSVELCMVYNRDLSASEIALLYREPFCMFDRDPIELWSAATQGEEAPVGNAGIMTTNTGYWGATY